MKRILLALLVASLLAVVIGCSAIPFGSNAVAPLTDQSKAYQDSGVTNSAGDAAVPPVPMSLPAATAAAAPAAGAEAQVPEDRKIVYTGTLSLQVNDTAETINKINDLLKGVNGYIANRSLVAYDQDKLKGTIVIRVPAAALDTTLTQIKALGLQVLKDESSSNDVTEEYVDLDARRKNLEAYEVELQKLLDTVRENTGKAEDILAVYNQLTEVRGQIDQIVGRQKYLENTSSLATYTIEFVPVEQVVVQGKPGWDPVRTAGTALDNLVGTLQGLGDWAIVFALYILPVLLIVILPVAVIVWLARMVLKRRSDKKVVVAG